MMSEDWNEERIDVIGSNGNTGEHYNKEPKALWMIPSLMKKAGWIRQQEPLTEERLSEISRKVWLDLDPSKGSFSLQVARAIEREHGIGVNDE